MAMVKKLLTATAISGALIVLTLSPASAGINESLASVVNMVQIAPEASFRVQELRAAYLHDIEGIKATLVIAGEEAEAAARKNLHQDALNTTNILISKTDSCATAGVPDADNWMTGCADAVPVHAALIQLADEISALIH